jgi:hypothetical protein
MHTHYWGRFRRNVLRREICKIVCSSNSRNMHLSLSSSPIISTSLNIVALRNYSAYFTGRLPNCVHLWAIWISKQKQFPHWLLAVDKTGAIDFWWSYWPFQMFPDPKLTDSFEWTCRYGLLSLISQPPFHREEWTWFEYSYLEYWPYRETSFVFITFVRAWMRNIISWYGWFEAISQPTL